MFKLYSRVSQTLGLQYPDEYIPRILSLKKLAEDEIAITIDDLLTNPQWIAGTSCQMTIGDAIKDALQDERTMVEIAAPLLTFPKATPELWNGEIDHVDTITGTYHLFTGKPSYIQYGDHLVTSFKGAPCIVPALKKVLGDSFNVTMMIDANKSPASRFIIVFPSASASSSSLVSTFGPYG